MTEIAFHFNAHDKLSYVCRLARKAARQGVRLVIKASQRDLQQLDRMLWNLSPSDFVTHCLAEADEEMRLTSSVLLAADPLSCDTRDLLVNLCDTVPQGFEHFSKVVEVVSQADQEDRSLARARWRHYVAQGYQIVRHDLVLREGA